MSADEAIIRYAPGKAIVLRNLTCVYCGGPFSERTPASREHVIGRRFVPRGCFDGQWNLIVNACEACNGAKADLEDDISAISMLPGPDGRHAIEDPRLASEAQRKALNARSRRTGKTVAGSYETVELRLPFEGGAFTFKGEAPPQIDDARIFRLAHYHFRGFFYLITFQPDTLKGGFVQGGFFPLITTRRADWGNLRMRWFMDLVKTWDLRIHAIGADTFFRMIIRRDPAGREVWAWAVEWNHAIRVVGFAGDETVIRSLAVGLPALDDDIALEGPEQFFSARIDQGLLDVEDDLFEPREGEA